MTSYSKACEVAEAERTMAASDPRYPVRAVTVICELDNSWSVECRNARGAIVTTIR